MIRNSQSKTQKIQSGFTEQIKDLAKQIELMKEVLIKQIDSLKLDSALIKLNYLTVKKLAQQYCTIWRIRNDQKWISDKQINLKLIYRATANWFQFQKIYEKCSDKCKVILLVKTKEGRRFGFNADCFKNYNGLCQSQNPNNIFLFLLNQNKNILRINLIVKRHFIQVVLIYYQGKDVIFTYLLSQIVMILLMLIKKAKVKKKDSQGMLQMEEFAISQQVKQKYLKLFEIKELKKILIQQQN
ncbi:hypothetical protein ABPG72_009303 [Tetrahymena utriculariae]